MNVDVTIFACSFVIVKEQSQKANNMQGPKILNPHENLSL